MWSRVILGLAAALVLLGVGFFIAYEHGIYKPQATAGIYFIKGGMLFDAVAPGARENPGIVIKDGLIACVGKTCKAPVDAEIVDADGMAILPGLIDLHVHFLGSSETAQNSGPVAAVWDSLRMHPDTRRALQEAGITTLRSVGDSQNHIFDVIQYLKDGYIEGPRIFAAGPMLTAPDGHPVKLITNEWMIAEFTEQLDDPDAARAVVARLAEQGADGIKAVYHGIESDSGEVVLRRMSYEVLSAICDEADRHGLWVAVHAGPTNKEVMDAVSAGVDTIEHGIRHGNIIDPETLQFLNDNNIVYVPTLGEEPLGHLNIERLHSADVFIGVGTDTIQNGRTYHAELRRLHDAGMSAPDVLIAATRNGARALNMTDRLGTIEPGKIADLIIVRGTPWRDLGDLENVDRVFQNGRPVVQ